MKTGPTLFCGDPHGRFRHIIDTAARTRASAVVLLGDMEPARPLHVELADLLRTGTPLYWIPGNHDADSDELWLRVWGSEIAHLNVHGKVVTLPNGQRLAGLGGVFREEVWHPDPASSRAGAPAFLSRDEHAKVTPDQDRWRGTGPPRKHWGSIYPEEVNCLASLQADILVAHEAPGYHPHGFDILDTLAQTTGVKVSVHGHQHDCLDSSERWAEQGFKSHGVGLRGITAIDADGNATIVVPGELDGQRQRRGDTHAN